MHRSKNDRLVEEDMVQRISIVCQHDVVTAVTVHEHFRCVDALFVVNVTSQMFESNIHGVLSWQSDIVSKVCTSGVDDHA